MRPPLVKHSLTDISPRRCNSALLDAPSACLCAGVPLHTAGAFPFSSTSESTTASEIRSPDQCKLQWCLHMSVTIQVEHLLLLFAGFAWTSILICLSRDYQKFPVFFSFSSLFLVFYVSFSPFSVTICWLVLCFLFIWVFYYCFFSLYSNMLYKIYFLEWRWPLKTLVLFLLLLKRCNL